MLAVVPVMLLMLAPQEVGEAVPLALQQPDEVVGAVVTLLQGQLGIIHLLLRGHHHCGKREASQHQSQPLAPPIPGVSLTGLEPI